MIRLWWTHLTFRLIGRLGGLGLAMGALVLSLSLSFSGCALLKKKSTQEPPPEPGSKLTAPHPEGEEYADFRSLFSRKDVPPSSALERCDFDYQVERRLSAGKEALFTTLPEHVKADPNGFHWCFYFKLYRIIEAAQVSDRHEEARKRIVEDYPFVTHVARVFQTDFGDVRYLRAAVSQYQKLSRALYFVGVVPTGRTAGELFEAPK